MIRLTNVTTDGRKQEADIDVDGKIGHVVRYGDGSYTVDPAWLTGRIGKAKSDVRRAITAAFEDATTD